MIKETRYICVVISVFYLVEMCLMLMKRAFKFSDGHFKGDYLIVLILDDCGDCGHIDVRLLMMGRQLM